MSFEPKPADTLHFWVYDLWKNRYTCVCGAVKTVNGAAVNAKAERLCDTRFADVHGLNVSDTPSQPHE